MRESADALSSSVLAPHPASGESVSHFVRIMNSYTNFGNLPQDVLIKIFLTFSDICDTCAVSEVCTSWSDAALSPQCWAYVRVIDSATRRRLIQQEASGTVVFECNVCFDCPTQFPCEACKPIPPKVTGKRKRKRRRTSNPQGVKLAVDVITRRAGKRLRLLDLHLCFPFHHLAAYQMHNSDLNVIAERSGPQLEGLAISSSVHLASLSIVNFAKACPELRVLHMMNCQSLKLSDLKVIVKACHYLEDISVSHCPQFHGRHIMQVVDPLRSTLRRLDMSFTPTESINLSQIIGSFPALEELIADHCSSLKCVVSNARSVGLDAPLTAINKLTTFRMDDTSLDVNMLHVLFDRSRDLQCLSANHIPPPSRVVLERVFDGYIPPLRTLRIASLPITDNIWKRIFCRLYDTLEFCDVSGYSKLTLALSTSQPKQFTRLKGIYITYTGATDRTLAQLLIRAPHLNMIDATGCRNVRHRAFRRSPLDYRPYLEEIAVGAHPSMFDLCPFQQSDG